MTLNILQFLFLAHIFGSMASWSSNSGAKDCMKLYFNVESIKTPCGRDFSSEAVRHIYKPPKAYAQCCIPGSLLDHVIFNFEARDCRTTSCLPKTTRNPCGHLSEIFVNRMKFDYKIAAQEPCTVIGTGPLSSVDGFVSLCCLSFSNEHQLAVLEGAEDNEFPHQVRINTEFGKCSATIYNRRYLITAAHCLLAKPKSSKMTAIIGRNIPDITVPEYVYQVRKTIPYPDYTHDQLGNDIALVELDRNIKFGENVKALDIAPPNFNPFNYANSVAFSGWGSTKPFYSATYLKKRNLKLRSDSECESVFGDIYARKKEKLVCLGGAEYRSMGYVNKGDSGGGAVCRDQNGRPVLCGVANFCHSNGSTLPSVFARVAYFHGWIQQVAGPQEKHTLYRSYLYGKKVAKSKYPHQVQILSATDPSDSCGGTLIEPDVVLTAAHCIYKYEIGIVPKDVVVKAGHVVFSVRAAEYLPWFQTVQFRWVELSRHEYYRYDLAVVLLTTNVAITSAELPRLPKNMETFSEGKELAVRVGEEKAIRVRDFTLMNDMECQERLERAGIFYGYIQNYGVFCGVEKFSGGSTCDRELGGGLICQGKDDREVLCGVQSFRLCSHSLPDNFVDVEEHAGWIRTTINELRSVKIESLGLWESFKQFAYNAHPGHWTLVLIFVVCCVQTVVLFYIFRYCFNPLSSRMV